MAAPPCRRRLLTSLPAVVLLAAGVGATTALVSRQVVLAVGVPLALVPLVALTADQAVTGGAVNGRAVTVLTVSVTVAVTTLDVLLLATL